jgi:hypothetical protein
MISAVGTRSLAAARADSLVAVDTSCDPLLLVHPDRECESDDNEIQVPLHERL